MSQSPYKGFNSHDLVHEFVEESYQSPIRGSIENFSNSSTRIKKVSIPPIRGSIDSFFVPLSTSGDMSQSSYKGFNSYLQELEAKDKLKMSQSPYKGFNRLKAVAYAKLSMKSSQSPYKGFNRG